uniref:Gse1 coiled-coil protein n=1 Tax=Gasterosteus aculeatus TaxID=69293 RepID=G3PTY9_GASAC
MSHEPKSPSLGMISTATRTTATVSPLTPSPLNGSLVANGSPANQSAHSGFAAALRKLAKQAEEPRAASSISSESSPVSSPATNHSSPVSTPKRGPLGPGPVLVPPAGHSVPNTPPVVTIAPTKTSNGLWRSEGRQQADSGPRGASRERLGGEGNLPQEKGGPSVPAHLLGNPYAFGLTPGAVMQDSRFQPLSLPRQLPPGHVPEEYLRGFRPYATTEDALRMPSLPFGLDPATAAAAAAYYHPSYLPHTSFSPYSRMDDPFCLSALRSPFYQLPGGGALPPIHPSAVHMHLQGVRYPGDFTHQSLSALQSESSTSLSTFAFFRLQLEDELRQRERERERERERDTLREKELQASKAMESHYLAELHSMRGQEDRTKPERLPPNRAAKILPPGLHSSMVQSHHPIPGLIPGHSLYMGSSAVVAGLSASMIAQRTNEEERWLARQRKLRQEKEDRQYQVSEFRQQVLEQHLDLGRPGDAPDHRTDPHRSVPNHHEPGSRDLHPHLGAPPPLISPKPLQPLREHHPPTTLWNPASLIETPSESRRNHEPLGMGHYELSRLPPGPSKYDDGPRRREGGPMEKYPPVRGPPGLPEPSTFLADLEKSTQSFFSQQRATLSLSSQYELEGAMKRPGTGQAATVGMGQDTMLIFDEFLQLHRRPVSKLDLEEKRRREAREKGYYYELDDSYDESDEEEVRAHLRRVAEQPPLKLDDSTEKVDFLGAFGLTTVGRRDELVQQKRRKRRRRLRERSPSPPFSHSKRTPPPPPQLSTRFTPEEMNRAPELEDKKRFLNTFKLSHVTIHQRRDNEKVVELLQAIKEKSVTLDTVRHAPHPLCKSPPAQSSDSAFVQPPSDSEGHHGVRPSSPSSHCPASPNGHLKPLGETLRPKEPPSPAVYPDKARGPSEGPASKRSSSLLNSLRPPHPLQAKEGPHSINGRTKPWDSFTPEEFAQQFHESVLQSTQKALQKHKGGVTGMSETSHLQESSVHYNIPELQGAPGRPPQPHPQSNSNAHSFGHPLSLAHPQPNGQHFSVAPHREASAPASKWQGIESIFEAYQEYVEEQTLERQVLQSQCRRLEAQNYNLSLSAEQLSHSMGELMSQRQKLAVEREKLQVELEHFRKCLTLPQTHWPRGGHYKGYPP